MPAFVLLATCSPLKLKSAPVVKPESPPASHATIGPETVRPVGDPTDDARRMR